jgi:hypothetical protein
MLRVLFVGNSFTFEDDLPGQVQALSVAQSEPMALVVGTVATPSQTLMGHYQVGDMEDALDAGTWDIVVLQEHHTMPFDAEATFYQYAGLLDAQIKAHGALTMLYVTWVESTQTPADQDFVTQSYLGLGQQLGATVVPVGPAWKNAMAAQPGIDLYDADGFHSNEKGSYLAAAVFYAALYGHSPVGAPSPNAGVGSDATLLQSTAWTTWQGADWTFP